MIVPDIFLLFFIVIAILYFSKIAWVEKRPWCRALALVICFFGLGLFYTQVSQYVFVDSGGSHSAIEDQYGSSVTAVDFQSSSLAQESTQFFSGNQDLGDTFLSGSKKTIYIDASQGLTDGNIKVLNQYFPHLSLEKSKEGENKRLCWIRNPLFPYASGLCQNRSVTYFMSGGFDDINRWGDDKTTAKVVEVYGKTIFLVSSFVDKKNASNEEICLGAIQKGRPCGAIEVLPSTATSALYISTKDPTIQSVLEEFNVSSSRDLTDALSIYSQKNTLATDFVEVKKPGEFLPCGGLSVTEASASLKVFDLTSARNELLKVDSESKLAKEVKALSAYLNCPGIYHLDIPIFKKKDIKTSARSFMSHLLKSSFWFTDTRSYINRYDQVKNVRVQVNQDFNKLRITSDNPIKNLAVTFVLPGAFPEEILQNINVINAQEGWRLYRIGPSSFRLSFDNLNGEAVVDLENFFGSLKNPHLGIKGFFQTPGVAFSLGVAFLLATLLTAVHVTSSKRPVIWPLTFAPVFFIQFVLIFLSFLTSRAIGVSDSLFARMETPAMPAHFFLRDWPDDWFESKNKWLSQVNAANLQKSEKWKQALKVAETESQKGSAEKSLRSLSFDGVVLSKAAGDRNVVVWDHPATRNFYFRKSSFYPAMILGWREIAKKDPSVSLSSAADFSQIENVKQRSVLVLPDIRFLNSQDEASVNQFVRGGGVLVFSEKLGGDDQEASLAGATEFKKVLEGVGLGHNKLLNYSKVGFSGFAVDDINTSHRVTLPQGGLFQGNKWGEGGVLFLGVLPVDGKSRQFVGEVLARISGESITVKHTDEQCSTGLLIQPWAGPAAELTRYAGQLKRAGYDVRWLVDARSLGNMATQWEKSFQADGVVILDDGKDSSRILAKSLLKSLNSHEQPVFASFKAVPNGEIAGPAGTLIQIKSFDDTDIQQQSKAMASECLTGFVMPRLLNASSSASWGALVQNLVTDRPKQMTGLKDYVDRLINLKANPGDTRKLYFKITNPVEFELEKR